MLSQQSGEVADWSETEIPFFRLGLSILRRVLSLAVEPDELDRKPCDDLRAMLRRRSRTKSARSDSQPKANPLTWDEIPALLDAMQSEGPVAYLATLVMLDAGLREGEAEGLRWQDVEWGREDSLSRLLRIQESIARGKHVGAPKSGRTRRVELSRRLRSTLRAYFMVQGQPKDLRDTFASWLLMRTGNLASVSHQLGHSDVGVTANHYARWTGGEAYRTPPRLAPGEVPADLLARLGADESGAGSASA